MGDTRGLPRQYGGDTSEWRAHDTTGSSSRIAEFSRLTLMLTLTFLFLGNISSAQEVRYRKHVDDMTAAEWKALGDAITALHQNDHGMDQQPTPNDQPLDRYEYFVKMHGSIAKREWGCKHVNELIWPWHRAFLLHFENALNAVKKPGAPTITLPYWDWTEPVSGNNGFPAPYEDQSSPLYHRRSSYPKASFPGSPLDIASPLPMTPAAQIVKDLLAVTSWESFGGSAESGPNPHAGSLELNTHNAIHGYIGTDNLRTILAVRDPIFWAHHANLDRLVAEWQALHRDQVQCFDCDAVAYHDPVLGDLSFRQLLDIESMPAADGRTVKVVYVPKGMGALMGEAFASRLEALSLMQADFAKTLAPQQLGFSFKFPDISGYRIKLEFKDLKVPQAHTYRIDAYVHPRSVRFQSGLQFAAKYKIASLTQFAAGHEAEDESNGAGHEHNPPTATTSIDVTRSLRQIAHHAAVGEDYILTVVFRSVEPQRPYSAIEQEVHLSGISLLREDFSTQEAIDLIPQKGIQ